MIMRRERPLKWFIVFIRKASPRMLSSILLGYLIHWVNKYMVEVPYYDEWNFIPLYYRQGWRTPPTPGQDEQKGPDIHRDPGLFYIKSRVPKSFGIPVVLIDITGTINV